MLVLRTVLPRLLRGLLVVVRRELLRRPRNQPIATSIHVVELNKFSLEQQFCSSRLAFQFDVFVFKRADEFVVMTLHLIHFPGVDDNAAVRRASFHHTALPIVP